MVKITCGKCSNAFEMPDVKATAKGICPVCGEEMAVSSPQISRLAVASLVSAVFAAAVFLVPRIVMTFFRLRLRVFMNPGVYILFIIAVLLAVVFGYIARSRIRRSNGELSGEGFATAGIRLGWMGAAYLVFMITILFSFYFSTRQRVLSCVSPDNRTMLVVERRYGRNVMSYVLIKKPNTFFPSRGEYLGALDFREYDFPEDTYIVWSSEPRMVAVWFGEELVWGYNLEAGQPVFLPIYAPLLPVPDHLQIHDTESLFFHLLDTGFCGEEFMAHAVYGGNSESVRILLALGVSANTPFATSSVLWAASARGHEEVVSMLLANGADVDSGSSTGGTPLMQAASGGHALIAEDLLGYGAGVNLQNDSGHTALMYAARAGREGMVKLLLSAGADIRVKNADGCTALDLAVENGHAGIADLLMSGE